MTREKQVATGPDLSNQPAAAPGGGLPDLSRVGWWESLRVARSETGTRDLQRAAVADIGALDVRIREFIDEAEDLAAQIAMHVATGTVEESGLQAALLLAGLGTDCGPLRTFLNVTAAYRDIMKIGLSELTPEGPSCSPPEGAMSHGAR
jgi:hypothetical protein